MQRQSMISLAIRVGLVVALSLAGVVGTVAAQNEQLVVFGSTLLRPLFKQWAARYAQEQPGIVIRTQSTGSGEEALQAASGVARIDASDVYLGSELMQRDPDMLNIPLAMASEMVAYNLPGLNGQHLKFSASVLAGIYQGDITKWDAREIAQLNPGVTLPDAAIMPIHRTDGSGETLVFGQYLSDGSTDWAGTLGYGTTIDWSIVSGSVGVRGEQGVVDALKRTPYAIGYVGVRFQGAIGADKLGVAMIENRAGAFVLPDSRSIQAAADAGASDPSSDGRIDMVFAPGADAYPLVNYEYAIVNAKQTGAAAARDLRDFLAWAVRSDGGNAEAFMQPAGVLPLPASVRRLSEAQIARIGG